MKKIMISLLMVAATLTAMAQSFSGFAELTLTSSDNKSCTLILAESTDLNAGKTNGYYAELSEEGKAVQLYVIFEGKKYEQFASNPNTMRNLPLGIKTNASATYTLIASNVEGSLRVMINGVEYTISANGTVFSDVALPANSTLADIADYRVNPTACTPVRNNLVVGRYYTICLPKAVENPAGASFWNLKYRNSEGTLAYLEEATGALVAGRPYIFQAEDTELCFEFSGDAEPAGGFGALVGTFVEMDQAALDLAGTDIYLLNNNELWLVSGRTDNVLPANRAYIAYDELIPGNPASAPGRRVRAIPMQGQVATGIETLNAADAPAKTIIDGKLYIIRDKHMFDATGRLVK